MDEEEDQWIETKQVNKNFVKKALDPADVIEINARCFTVKDFYLDEMVSNLLKDKNINLS